MNAAAEDAPTQDSATESAVAQSSEVQSATTSETVSVSHNDPASSHLEDPNAPRDASSDEHLYSESHEERI